MINVTCQNFKTFISDTPSASQDRVSWESQRQKRNHQGGDERTAINAARHGAQLLSQLLVADALFACVHVARPARGHRDSSLLARLHQAQPRDPDREENDGARPARRARDDQHEGHTDADGESHYPEQPSFALLAWANVDDVGKH